MGGEESRGVIDSLGSGRVPELRRRGEMRKARRVRGATLSSSHFHSQNRLSSL